MRPCPLRQLGLGLSSFVSVGNKPDISGNDLLGYWGDDPRTDLVLLYLESFGNPRKFARIARRLGRSKPVIAVKSGRSVAGARASGSHTGALLAASDVTVEALFRQEELAAFLPAEASTGNPVDLLAAAPAEHHRRAVELVARSGEVDAVIAIFIPLPRWLAPDEVARLLACYALPLAPWRLVETASQAGAAAAELGGQVALKAVAPTLLHKTEAGAVRLGLSGAERVTQAAELMARQITLAGHQPGGFLVQRMAAPGVELLVGVVHDPSFGPVVACGAGGTAVELLKDVAVRITPLTDLDAHQMVRSLATFLPLLDGYRGAPKADVPALEDVLLRISTLVDDRPEVAELDCNPVIVGPGSAVIVDARVRIEHPAPPPPLGARRTP